MKIKNILGACLIAGTMIFTPTAGVVPAPVAYAESVADYTEKIADCIRKIEIKTVYDPMYLNYSELEFQPLPNEKLTQLNKDSISKYSELLNQDGNDSGTYIQRGIVYYRLHDYERAVADFSRAIELVPNFAGLYYNRGTACYRLGNYDAALEDYSRAIELDSKDALLYIQRGSVYTALNQYEKAIADYDKAVQLPLDAAPVFNGKILNFDSVKIDSAIVIYYRKSQLPQYSLPYLKRGIAYLYLKQYDAAKNDFDRSIKANSKDAVAYQLRGICYEMSGKDKKARADFAKAQKFGY